jgi:hypothetical protein
VCQTQDTIEHCAGTHDHGAAQAHEYSDVSRLDARPTQVVTSVYMRQVSRREKFVECYFTVLRGRLGSGCLSACIDAESMDEKFVTQEIIHNMSHAYVHTLRK